MDYLQMLKRARKNIQKSDETKRFQIPELIITGRKQTVIKNFSDVAKTIRRDPKDIAKFLFKSLAVPGSMKERELELQGKVSHSLIEKRIEEYVNEFVLCPECGKADTIINKMGKIIILKCEACGAKKTMKKI